jgi:alkanesulfonate monooxygenase SsuD/methylene tetrahydromethanopterin reductase-like flavin-dependent oxidoreductase (luciferase family)
MCLLTVRIVARDRARGAARAPQLLDQMDHKEVENFARAMGINSGSYDRFTLEMLALGAGAKPIIGTKEQVAEKLANLHRNGLDGMLMVFLSYLEDTLRFEREILPLLEQLEVR